MLAQQSYNGKSFESKIFNNMWCIRLWPNGIGWNKDCIGKCMVRLQQCAYELNVESIDIVWTTAIYEMNVRKTIKHDKFKIKTRLFPIMGIGSFSHFKKCTEFDIKIDVIILKQYNKNNEEIEMKSKWDNYIQDEKKQMDEVCMCYDCNVFLI